MQLRRQNASVDVARVRHSLMEPALRLKHSLQEPLERLRHSMMEPQPTAGGGGTLGMTYNPHHHHLEPGFAKLGGGSATASVIKPSPTPPASSSHAVTASLGPVGTARRIIQREGFGALYKGKEAKNKTKNKNKKNNK